MTKQSFYAVDAPTTTTKDSLVLNTLADIVTEHIDVPVAVPAAVTGAKYDTGKHTWGLLMGGCGLALKAVVEILMMGAAKYAANAWQDVPNGYARYKDALYRHMHSIEENGPGSIDDESGKLDLAHCGCNILFMLWYQLKGKA